jgi:hypothetical protein
LLFVVPAGAAFADPDIGCGLGTQLWEGNKGLIPKVLGATTNGSFGNQTFGITFQTIGCHSTGTVTADARSTCSRANRSSGARHGERPGRCLTLAQP